LGEQAADYKNTFVSDAVCCALPGTSIDEKATENEVKADGDKWYSPKSKEKRGTVRNTGFPRPVPYNGF
jgi:hypothetical protein